MPVFVGVILEWIVSSTLARVLWASVAWWFLQGLVPVIVSTINDGVGNPFSLIPAGAWWLLDVIGFDVWVPKVFSALVVGFVIKRIASK